MHYVVRTQRLEAVPLAVVRRRARQNEFSVLVPQCCGIVWKTIKDAGVQGVAATSPLIAGILMAHLT